ncbi:diguanylate cyclase [Desulfoscipio geothermicus]|uniref:Stage 0 sporulation protein A homolog n=1 Tax=Desulfoscipio geothermicus DSM 3669 TaxID=1121426 RepID=A0A1I6DWK6_9FIRM|nr:diguanylate cyclase [Desulfoscipio geothermicus]SFR09825.1 diguanylate cyclase (GGDEF) domain-containing protein [Desulfoscipio geothermicus DSM 3669]
MSLSNVIALYSTDKNTISAVATAIDYNLVVLQITGNLNALGLSMSKLPPDALIIDVPDDPMQLKDLSRFFESVSPVTPVLLLTSGHTNNKSSLATLQFLYAFNIKKPFAPAQLYNTIQSLLTAVKTTRHEQKTISGQREKPLVLVVEDSPLQMNILLRYLEGQDMEVITAMDGLQALKTATERIPDLVLLDVVLPGMDGFEVCRRIKASPTTSEVLVIIVTTLSSREDKLKCLQNGADEFLTKPIDRQELLLKTSSLLKRKYQLAALANQVIKDPLTGLYNRRYMESMLEKELLDAQRDNTPLSLVMLDVDYFKIYNDTNGHPAGDEVLASIGKILTDLLRQCDTIIRYGGEEFLVILPQTGPDGASQVAEKIRRSIEEFPFPHRESQPGGKVTVSLGVASFPDHSFNVAELVELADKALYRAKREGRNCFRTA